MKRLLLIAVLLPCLIFTSLAQNNVGINDNNSNPDASAMLDINSTSKGMLIPRVSLTATADITTIAAPAASLLVYNTATAADVIPGYYYWDGNKWVRLQSTGSGIQKLSTVTKTTSGSIAKTDNMVFASGDITLTLPVVTGADNGLEITVKNCGTYMDLVVLTGATGSESIDESISVTLYRNWARTYIAKDGNWVRREHTSRSENIFDVSAKSSWTTIAQVIEFLGAHMTGPSIIRLGGGTYDITATQTINLPYPLTIEGGSFGETEITCSSGSPAFNAQTECYFKMLMFTGIKSGIGIQFSGAGVYHEIKDCYFSDFTNAINITGSAELWLFETDFEDCTSSGVDIAAGAANVNFKISESDFTNCARGINMATYGTGSIFSVLNCTFYNNSAIQTGIVYKPGNSAPYFSSMIIQGNSFNNVGIFASGFDFARPDGRDSKVFMENNAGVPSERPQCKINVANSTTTTTIFTANIWYRATNFTAFTSFTTKWTVANNKITYQPTNVRDGVAFISGNIKCDNPNRTINIALVKNTAASPQSNPIRLGETTVRIPVSSAGYSFQFSLNAYLAKLVKDDYFEIWVTSNNSGDVLTIDDLNWYTDTH